MIQIATTKHKLRSTPEDVHQQQHWLLRRDKFWQRNCSEIKNKNQKISVHLILNFVLVQECFDILFHSNSISLETRTTWMLSAPGKLSQVCTTSKVYIHSIQGADYLWSSVLPAVLDYKHCIKFLAQYWSQTVLYLCVRGKFKKEALQK